jgi:SAM-dependent methyltransferase
MRLQVAPIKRAVRRYGGIAFDWLHRNVDRIYDYRHGTDTTGVVDARELSTTSENRIHSQGYQASSPLLFRTMMKHLHIAYENFVFVDIGSGKGRALLLASEYPFAEVIGVEFSRQLHDAAAQNLKVYRNRRQLCRSIRLACEDACDFAFPRRNMVVYLYNPFDDLVMTKVINNIATTVRDTDLDLFILYYNARYSPALEQIGVVPYVRNIKIPPLVMRRPRDISKVLIYSNRPSTSGRLLGRLRDTPA